MDDAFSASGANSPLTSEQSTPLRILKDDPSALAATGATILEVAPNAEWKVLIENDNAHIVQFYEEHAYLLDAVADYIANALRAGDAGVVIATKTHRDGIEQRLKLAGLDIDAAQAEGQYVVHDALNTLSQFMVDGTPDADRFNTTVGQIVRTAVASYPRVRIFGGMVALLVADGRYDATLELERLWNELQ